MWKPPKSAVEIVKVRTGWYVLAHKKVDTKKQAQIAARSVKATLKKARKTGG